MYPNSSTGLLRHFLAALAYRTQSALRDAPEDFADFRAGENVRTPHELVWHMTGVIGYASSLFRGDAWRPDRSATFADEVRRFHDQLTELARHLETGTWPDGVTPQRLLQGPLADAMTHVGQIALLRRLHGRPVAPENFLLADVSSENLGPEQARARAPKVGWRPDQPPPAPGRPLA
jgi:hypothetical protein